MQDTIVLRSYFTNSHSDISYKTRFTKWTLYYSCFNHCSCWWWWPAQYKLLYWNVFRTAGGSFIFCHDNLAFLSCTQPFCLAPRIMWVALICRPKYIWKQCAKQKIACLFMTISLHSSQSFRNCTILRLIVVNRILVIVIMLRFST